MGGEEVEGGLDGEDRVGEEPREGCVGKCKADALCQLRASESQFNCATTHFGVNLRKRSDDGGSGNQLQHQHEHECDGSMAAEILSSLASDPTALRNRS